MESAGDLRQITEQIGEESIQRAFELRSSIQDHTFRNEAITGSEPLDGSNLLRSNHPRIFSGIRLTPWKWNEIPVTLPELPEILDENLKRMTFRHRATGTGRDYDFDNYEQLEWIGDVYVETAATLLISHTFPELDPGKCSQMRESLVKNVTLADYAKQYGFLERAQLPDALKGSSLTPASEHDRIKVLGDMFEAYVAAVILSDPTYGLDRAMRWLKDLWGPAIRKRLSRSGAHPAVQGGHPIWNLGTNDLVDQEERGKRILNPKEELQRALGSKGIKLTYTDAAPQKKSKDNKLPIFTVGVYLDGWGEKNKQLGIGQAHGKKEAGYKAAQMALQNQKLMKIYQAKKKLFDAQSEKEQKLLDVQAEK